MTIKLVAGVTQATVSTSLGWTALKTSAAMAMVLAAAVGASRANGQAVADVTSPDASVDPAGPLLAGIVEDQAAGAAGREPQRDSVYVFGRKVSSSVATVPDIEGAPQIINVISAETLAEQGVASLEQARRNVPGITTQIAQRLQPHGRTLLRAGSWQPGHAGPGPHIHCNPRRGLLILPSHLAWSTMSYDWGGLDIRFAPIFSGQMFSGPFFS